MKDVITPQEQLDGRYLVEPYLDWVKKQNIPVHEDFGFDLLAVETSDWAWYDAKGCFNHAHGRGDFMANYLIEVLPGKKTRPVKHLYEASPFRSIANIRSSIRRGKKPRAFPSPMTGR